MVLVIYKNFKKKKSLGKNSTSVCQKKVKTGYFLCQGLDLQKGKPFVKNSSAYFF